MGWNPTLACFFASFLGFLNKSLIKEILVLDLSTLGQNTVRECENFATEGQTGMELVTGPFGQCGSKMIRRVRGR